MVSRSTGFDLTSATKALTGSECLVSSIFTGLGLIGLISSPATFFLKLLCLFSALAFFSTPFGSNAWRTGGLF
jgi:hypothetical protein